jgi:hypothetical protein
VAASKGTNACENAPSANNRRKRLGMRKATLNASVAALAPKLAAMSCSRTKPVIRETRVSSETVEAALSRFTWDRWAAGVGCAWRPVAGIAGGAAGAAGAAGAVVGGSEAL